jgi:hypothetical protein
VKDPDDVLRSRILGGLRDLGCDADHPVRISELCRALRPVSLNDLHRLLLDLESSGRISLSAGKPESTDSETVFHLRRGLLTLVRLAPSRRPKASWPELRERVLDRVMVLRHCPGCRCRPVAWFRKALPDVPREELDQALVILELAGVIVLGPAPDPDALPLLVRRGAIDGHDRGLLAYVATKG